MKQWEKMSKYKEYLKYGFDRKPSTEELSDKTIIEMTKSMDIDTQKILDKLEEMRERENEYDNKFDRTIKGIFC